VKTQNFYAINYFDYRGTVTPFILYILLLAINLFLKFQNFEIANYQKAKLIILFL